VTNDFLLGFTLGFIAGTADIEKRLDEAQAQLDEAHGQMRAEIAAADARMRERLAKMAERYGIELPDPDPPRAVQ